MKKANREVISGVVVQGHRVASGQGGDPRFPGGTLAMQVPAFQARGLDLSAYYRGTVNLSVAPLRPRLIRPFRTFRQVQWHPSEPAEDFSFVEVEIRMAGEEWVPGLIYHPHPETKPAHFQAPDILEILARERIPGFSTGVEVELAFDPSDLTMD